MAYDTRLADEVRLRIGERPDVTEREMFGGVAFMIRGNLAVGVSGDDLMVRIGKDGHDEAVSQPGVRTFDMTGRPMSGWVLVAPSALASDDQIDAWIARGVDHALSLPPK